MSDIQCIGSIDGQIHYQPTQIAALLQQPAQVVAQGADFTGKPETNIYTDTTNVVKIHGEVCLESPTAKAWVQKALLKERAYRIYHPHKTWFIQIKPERECATIGNICPKLTPLHILFEQQTVEVDTCLSHFQQLFNMYFKLANQLKIRLDEGLSNFAIDAHGQLYYVDDDVYTWDKTVGLGQMLGVYFRSLSWLNHDVAAQLGQDCQQAIVASFKSYEYAVVLAEQIKHVFIPNSDVNECVNGFIAGLSQRPQTTTPVAAQKTPQHHPNPDPVPTKNATKFAVLADVHANLPALNAVLDFLDEHDIQQGWVLGDVVGYGPHPNECIQRLQQTQLTVIKGNHDNAIATQEHPLFSRNAAWVINWTQQQLDETSKAWLEALPSVIETPDWLLIHGAPVDPTFFNGYIYTMTYEQNLDVLEKRQIPLCFHGHTHMPSIFTRSQNLPDQQHNNKDFFDFNTCQHALVCSGSVGQPRNQNIQAQFAVYDQSNNTIQYHRLDYDVESVIQDMEALKFPEALIKNLSGLL